MKALEQQVDSDRSPGTAVMIGFPASSATFNVNPTHVIRDEKVLTGSILGSAHTHRDFARYGQFFLEGKLPIDRLITHTYRLAQINQACANMMSGAAGRGVIPV